MPPRGHCELRGDGTSVVLEYGVLAGCARGHVTHTTPYPDMEGPVHTRSGDQSLQVLVSWNLSFFFFSHFSPISLSFQLSALPLNALSMAMATIVSVSSLYLESWLASRASAWALASDKNLSKCSCASLMPSKMKWARSCCGKRCAFHSLERVSLVLCLLFDFLLVVVVLVFVVINFRSLLELSLHCLYGLPFFSFSSSCSSLPFSTCLSLGPVYMNATTEKQRFHS